MSLHEVLVFELLFEQLVFLLQMALFQLPHGSLSCCSQTHKWTKDKVEQLHWRTINRLNGGEYLLKHKIEQKTQRQLWAEVTSLTGNGWMLEVLTSTTNDFANEVSALKIWTIYLSIFIHSENILQAPKAQLQPPVTWFSEHFWEALFVQLLAH